MNWISVEGEQPIDGKLVSILVDNGGGSYTQGAYIWRSPKGRISDWFTPPYTKLNISHWAYPPDPPENES